jgi:catechol 2,3-dioxygenase-like lactoylglutathione lyase family enzyme
MLQGSINHVSVTVSDLDEAMEFFGPVLAFLGYTPGAAVRDPSTGTRLAVDLNAANGIAFNVWEAKPEHARHPFEVYEPGLHHVAFNVAARGQVDALADLVRGLGAEILQGPATSRTTTTGSATTPCTSSGPTGSSSRGCTCPGWSRPTAAAVFWSRALAQPDPLARSGTGQRARRNR